MAIVLLPHSQIHGAMTQFSRSKQGDPETDPVIASIGADLRRQRADLQRLRESSTASSSETTRIMDKISELRRKLEAAAEQDDRS